MLPSSHFRLLLLCGVVSPVRLIFFFLPRISAALRVSVVCHPLCKAVYTHCDDFCQAIFLNSFHNSLVQRNKRVE
jgi:hypothetical protein